MPTFKGCGKASGFPRKRGYGLHGKHGHGQHWREDRCVGLTSGAMQSEKVCFNFLQFTHLAHATSLVLQNFKTYLRSQDAIMIWWEQLIQSPSRPECECFTCDESSVFKHLSFRGFLHLGNPRKPEKTRKLGNLATYVLFPGNSQNDELSATEN